MERTILRGLSYVVLLLASFVYVVDGFSGRDVSQAGLIALGAFATLTISAAPPAVVVAAPATAGEPPAAAGPDRSGSRPPRIGQRTG